MTPAQPVQKKVVKARIFDLEKFAKVTLEKEITIPADASNLKEALERVGNDQAKLLSVVNVGLKRNLLTETRKAMQAESGGVDTSTIAKFVAAIRMMPKFAKMNPTNEPGEARKKQTQAIYEYIKANPVLLEDLKESAMESEADEEEEEETEE